MLVDFVRLRKTWVLNQGTDAGLPVGKIEDAIVDPVTGFIPALWVQTPQGMKILPAEDIVRWQQKHIMVKDETVLVDVEEYPRLNPILEKEVPIMNAPVYEAEKNLGRVSNFTIETLMPRMMAVICTRGMWWWKDERVIPRNNIYKIDEKGVLVGDTKMKMPLREIPEGEDI